ncbi:hypothetical protein [Micromonospora okii]|uniref:hypothetical protein n=1 Tax=Micromonospora okii TaxID=1182970 RepID=UPI001E33233C|nr:hypothetical protein [Micromonospora okii]
MSIDHGDRTGATSRAVGALETRRFRGGDWLPADDVVVLVRAADERIAVLDGEAQRLRRENETLVQQVEMLRHGALPSAVPQGPDPMAIELAARAQDEASRTISEASAEGAEIVADARRQADDILAEAHRRAQTVAGRSGPHAEEVQERVRELEARNAALVAAVTAGQQQFARWQSHLLAQAEQLRADAVAAGAAGHQLGQALGG